MDNTNVLTVYTSDELTNKIKGAMYDIARGFVYIGFLLAECEYFHTYLEWGYKSIYEYARSELGFKKSSVNNFINVCKTFSSNFSNVDSGFSLPFSSIMKDTYANYNYSQLVEMLSMSDKQRSQVTPDMTIKQIRELKKVNTSVDDSRRLEDVPAPAPAAPEEPIIETDIVSYPGYDLLIPLKDDLRPLFLSIQEAYLKLDHNSATDLFEMVFGFLKSNDYIICKKVNRKHRNRFAIK